MNEYENNQYDGFTDQSEPPQKENKELAIISLVLSVSGLFTFWCCGIGTLFILAGIILAIVSLCEKKGGRGIALAGLITSIIGIIVMIISFFAIGFI